MRQITRNAVNAFYANKEFSSSNTKVICDEYSTKLILHNRVIAKRTPKGTTISTCGYNTPTTKERLNGLVGVKVNTLKGELYLNGEKWDGEKTYLKELDSVSVNATRWGDTFGNTYFTAEIDYKIKDFSEFRTKKLEFQYGYEDQYLTEVCAYFEGVLGLEISSISHLKNITKNLTYRVVDVKRKKDMI